MNAVIDKIAPLVAEELAAANVIHSAFHSLHEGWAVLKEEIEEAHDEYTRLSTMLWDMWNAVKRDATAEALEDASNIELFATNLAAEAIQAAAMARKVQASIERGDAS